MSAEECRNFVHAAVSHAMARDGSSGGCIRTVTIDATGVRRTFTPGSEVVPSSAACPSLAEHALTCSALQVPVHFGELPLGPRSAQVAA